MRTRAEQVESIRADQQFWRDLAAEVGPERYADPGPMGDWSFADMAGHLLGWRNRTIARLDALGRGEPEPAPPWPPELDDDGPINDWFRDAGRRPRAGAAGGRLRRLLRPADRGDRGACPTTMLADPGAFPWLEGPLTDADFTSHLHEEHVPAVRAWLDG